jgi:hypothetical protein
VRTHITPAPHPWLLAWLARSPPLQAVIRGPHELPGAVAVEDERGRVVQLDRLDRHKREGLAKALLSTTASGVWCACVCVWAAGWPGLLAGIKKCLEGPLLHTILSWTPKLW